MQVKVQNWTSTGLPRSDAGVSGSELSHPVAPSSDGRWPSTGSSSAVVMAEESREAARGRARDVPGWDPGPPTPDGVGREVLVKALDFRSDDRKVHLPDWERNSGDQG